MSLYDFSIKIFELKKEDRFDEAIKFFNNNYEKFGKEKIASNKWIISNMIHCFRKSGQNSKIQQFLNEFGIKIDKNCDELILNSYGWSVYDNIKNKVYSKQYILYGLRDFIKLLFDKNSIYTYRVISLIFKAGVRFARDGANVDYNFLNEFCDLFDVDILSKEIEYYQGKELASDKEQWYSIKSKALFEKKEFKKCYEVSKEALDNLTKFHNNNNIWFLRRIALSKKEMGQIDEAIDELKEIFKRKKEWYIKKELANLYYLKGNLDESFKLAIKAIKMGGDFDKKIGAMILVGKILKKQNEIELAKKHFYMVRLIREKNQWKVDNNLKMETIDMDENIDFNSLKNELNNFWDSKIPKEIGEIVKILHNNERGVDGFLKYKDKDYYFKLRKNRLNKILKVGCEVDIEIDEDKKRAFIIRVRD